MTRFLLDTDTLIDFSKGAEPATSSILSWADGTDIVAACAVSVAEFYSGVPASETEIWDRFFASLVYWDIGWEAARMAGQLRFSLARAGSSMTTTDALLAALALERGATLVTGNVKHYPIPDLSLRSIRS